jgi:hypothetical protein
MSVHDPGSPLTLNTINSRGMMARTDFYVRSLSELSLVDKTRSKHRRPAQNPPSESAPPPSIRWATGRCSSDGTVALAFAFVIPKARWVTLRNLMHLLHWATRERGHNHADGDYWRMRIP